MIRGCMERGRMADAIPLLDAALMQEADETRVNDVYVHLGWERRADDVTPPNP